MSQKRSNSIQRFNRKLKKSIKQLLKQFKILFQMQGKWLLRCLLITKKIPQTSLSLIKNLSKEIKQLLGKLFFSTPKTSLYRGKGFILPTIAIVLLVFALVVGSIIFRSANRTQQVIDQRAKQIVETATIPAIQRAKAKLSYLFNEDKRYPNGLADGKRLDQLLKQEDKNSYDLPDETRIDLDVNGDPDDNNAWKFEQDIDGDGVPETIAYSILTRVKNDSGNITLEENTDKEKADNLIVRNAPISLKEPLEGCQSSVNSQDGWYPNSGSSSNFLRTFQINAVAIKNNGGDKAYTALEVQQDRESDLGNKWGAWFLYDLEMHPGPDFRWNGAIHTEGNLIVGNSRVRGYLVSDPKSCFYKKTNSEVTLAQFDGKNTSGLKGTADPDPTEENGGRVFQGQMISGHTGANSSNRTRDRSQWDIFNNPPITGRNENRIDRNGDSINNTTNLAPRLLDPVLLFTEGLKQTRGNTSTINTATLPDPAPQEINTTRGNTNSVSNAWPDRDLVTNERIYNNPEQPPFVDDIYRADNRYGPKPRYTDIIDYPLDTNDKYIRRSGNEIQGNDYNNDAGANNDNAPQQLTDIDLSQKTFDNVGYDGYWERRAWAEGLRIIIGQRLNLGNAYGWGSSKVNAAGEPDPNGFANQDPLYPPYDATLKTGGRPYACRFYTTATSYNRNNIDRNRCHEHRQWKTLRDNLAAVQATAIYTNYLDKNNPGYDKTKREFPAACIATTAHPGTKQTIDDSTTFNYYPGTNNVIDTNFLQGKGTNGWEFNPPGNFTSEAQFAGEINNPKSPLRIALTNLAYFAGDPDGAFPARQDDAALSNAITHPYPYTAMWGDFSNLRRVIDILDGNYTDTRPGGTIFTPNYTYQTVSPTGSNTNDLSIADKTTLQTAACTLGILAYNLDNIQNNQGFLKEVSDKLASQYDKDKGANLLPSDDSNSDGAVAEYKTAIGEDLVKRIELIEQVSRDRLLGFKNSDPSVISPERQNYTVNADFQYGNKIYGPSGITQLIDLGFDFSSETGNNYFGIGQPNTAEKEQQFIRLALLVRDTIKDGSKDFFDDVTKPKYPALFYLFPKTEHDEDGTNGGTNPDFGSNSLYKDGQDEQFDGTDLNEEYVVNISDLPETIQIRQDGGTDYIYQPLNRSNVNDFSRVETTPRTLNIGSNSWKFQCAVTATSSSISCDDDRNSVGNKIIVPNGDSKYVTVLDKGIFNGREQMSVRSLDIDLNRLRHNRASDMSENWLPDSGIVYAFREDTVREDGIERPNRANFAACNTLEKITNVNISSTGNGGTRNCVMDAVGSVNGQQQDPPLEDQKLISPKPIDIYSDPDRRPNGFRLRNGRDLRRCHADFGNGTGESVLSGLSFITDSSTYIQADNLGFNLHIAKDRDCDNGSYDDSKRIEEFKNKLNTDFSNFYTRSTNAPDKGVDARFAREGDIWRPTTVLADSVNIVSNKFLDGTISDGLIVPQYNSSNDYPYPKPYLKKDNSSPEPQLTIPTCIIRRCTSYFNLKYPRWISNNDNNNNIPALVREDGNNSVVNNRINSIRNFGSPIKISRNGYALYNEGGNIREFGNEFSSRSDNFLSFEFRSNLIKPDNGNRVNAVIISGISPSRAGQGYGGIHNFPRFNEDWSGKDLFISGSLLQLNFNTSGTGPFEQDSWEPTHRPSSSRQNLSNYIPPNRRWGYDVGLQIAPAGPVEERFVSRSSNFSEFYQQLQIDDPYIVNLRCAEDASNKKVDPEVDTNQCPS